MYRITSTETAQVADSLHVLLDLTALFRDCEEEIPVDIELWLLTAEVLAHDGLQQYAEADTLVNRFFDTYFDKEETSDFYRAKFYMWWMHLSALSGALVDMVVAYTEAQKYADSLDVTHRASHYLDGAYAYMIRMGEYEAALLLIQDARALISRTDTLIRARQVRARALLLEGEAGLWLRRELPQVRETLREAAQLYSRLGDTSRVAIATTLLGLAHAAEGDTSAALSHLATASHLAERSGSIRSRAFTHWRHGKVLRQSGNHDAALPVLRKALEAAKICQEFYLEAAYELAWLFEERGKFDEATSYYRIVLDAPTPRSFSAALEAKRKTDAAVFHLLLIESKREHRRNRSLNGILLLMVVGLAFMFLLRRWRPLSPVIEHGEGGMYLPYEMPTGLSLDELKARFQTIPDITELATRRLAYAYAILFERALIRAYVTDPYLQPQVEEDRLKDNSALFLVIAPIETAVDQQIFSGRPENSIRSHLRGVFDKHRWPWPSHPTEWKRYFLEYHMETVYGDSAKEAPGASEAE